VDRSRSGASARVGAISLAPFADADGIPEADGIAIIGERARTSRSSGSTARRAPRATLAVSLSPTLSRTHPVRP
jgi:hypothetical protein